MDIVILTYTLLEENAYRIATLLEQNAYVPNPREQECIRENKKKWEEERYKSIVVGVFRTIIQCTCS
ncbi:hypothetical protein RCL_jg11802.t1 [Rhizophagus clarus]|uniref:Uncharacterized protein n=1 Tax=Rhizophagus clarus TaxID=94130 RepID=A0A8H3ME70_9GLOM|nr:hypothetical protein RCL_jg11802.t1 [Rhizophagus clarus]